MKETAGFSVHIQEWPAFPRRQADLTGVSCTLSLRTLSVRVYQLLDGTFAPLANYSVTVRLGHATPGVTLVTDAMGLGYLEFSAINASPALSPVSYRAVLRCSPGADPASGISITLLPVRPRRTAAPSKSFRRVHKSVGPADPGATAVATA